MNNVNIGTFIMDNSDYLTINDISTNQTVEVHGLIVIQELSPSHFAMNNTNQILSLNAINIFFKEVDIIQLGIEFNCKNIHYENNKIAEIPLNWNPKCETLNLSNNIITDISFYYL